MNKAIFSILGDEMNEAWVDAQGAAMSTHVETVIRIHLCAQLLHILSLTFVSIEL